MVLMFARTTQVITLAARSGRVCDFLHLFAMRLHTSACTQWHCKCQVQVERMPDASTGVTPVSLLYYRDL